MIRRIFIAGIVAAGLLAPLSAALPASAGNGVGCDGSDCNILLSQLITLKGDVGAGSGYAHIGGGPPPPCLWQPIGHAKAGSSYIIEFLAGTDPGPNGLFGTHDSFLLAKKLLKHPQPGTWYELPANPAASTAGKQACAKLPLFYWVPLGGTLPSPPVSPETIARYAYNHMRIPRPRIVVNPAGKAYVNLGTYVWARWPVSQYTHKLNKYEIVAQLGTEIVTVRALAGPLQVNVNGPGSASSNCPPSGSKARPVGRAPASAGAGVAPDCGVLWQGPDAQAGVSATVTWKVSWWQGNGRRAALPPITLSSRPLTFPVSEIQSVNGR